MTTTTQTTTPAETPAPKPAVQRSGNATFCKARGPNDRKWGR